MEQDLAHWRAVTQMANEKVAELERVEKIKADIEAALGIPGNTWGGGASPDGSSGDSGANSGTPTGFEAWKKGEESGGVLSEFLAAAGGLPDFLKFFAD